jgi:hypothetical protein
MPILDPLSIDRFMSMIGPKTENGCVPWIGNITQNGYGQVKIKQQPYYAHRIAYWIKFQVDPKELLVCHTCNNPACVNTDHMYLGTNSDNMLQKFREGRASNKGEKHSQAKLNELLVHKIRNLSMFGFRIIDITKELRHIIPDLDTETVANVIKRKTWSHI